MTHGKMVVLKPVVWNDQGYRWPAGRIATSGYTKESGYGHEEWNGRDDWVWNGWKIFHTEAKGRMHRYAESGRLGIIMTAMNEGRFYAVGVGCNVFGNTEVDSAAIWKALKLHDYADRMWEVESIRRAKKTKAAFNRHWLGHTHIAWRCPTTHYAWFTEPVAIIPNALIPRDPPRDAIVKMHGTYQQIRPDQALSIVRQALPDNHSVIGWLSTADFDEVRNKDVREAPSPKGRPIRSASTASDAYRRYMQENEILVSPLHYKLQQDFFDHLKDQHRSDIKQNISSVDLRYFDSERGNVLVEIKPTSPETVRFAIRTAMGQLLDYRQRASGRHSLLIVLDNQPSDEDKLLAISNGFAISWRGENSFVCEWPN